MALVPQMLKNNGYLRHYFYVCPCLSSSACKNVQFVRLLIVGRWSERLSRRLSALRNKQVKDNQCRNVILAGENEKIFVFPIVLYSSKF